MKKIILFAVSILVLSNYLLSQKKVGTIELNPYLRYDAYTEFLSINESYMQISTKLKGTSTGINVNYKLPTRSNYQLFIGLGYYRSTFNNITSKKTTISQTFNSRQMGDVNINFTNTYTDKYWYNNIALNIGFDRNIVLKKNSLISIGAIINNFFCYSQYYHFDYPLVNSKDHLSSNNSSFGVSANLQIGFLKTINRFSIGPKLIIPVFDNKKKDKNFAYDIGTGAKDKWFNGIGIGISCNYSLK